MLRKQVIGNWKDGKCFNTPRRAEEGEQPTNSAARTEKASSHRKVVLARLESILCTAVVAAITVLPTSGRAQNLSGFSDTLTEHVFYIDFNQHVRQLYLNVSNKWANQDLTSISGDANLASWEGSGTTSFNDVNGEHVFYIGTDGFVYQLYLPWGGNWQNLNLMFWIFPLNLANSVLDSFADRAGEHVFYSSNNHIYQLYAGWGGGWVNQDLTAMAGGITFPGGAGAAAAFTDSNGEHVAYTGQHSHIHELYFQWGGDGKWVDLDLTKQTGGPPSGFELTAFTDQAGEHVIYSSAGPTSTVEQLWAGLGNGWVNQNLQTMAKGNPPYPNTALSSFADVMREHAYYIDSDLHVIRLYDRTSWFAQDLTVIAKAPVSANGCASILTSFSDGVGEHVFYLGSDGNVHLLYWNTIGWVPDQNLTASQPSSQRPAYGCIE